MGTCEGSVISNFAPPGNSSSRAGPSVPAFMAAGGAGASVGP